MSTENENVNVTQGGLSSGVPLKVVGGTGKGGIATVQAPTGMLMDNKTSSGILANMEKLAAQIQDPWRQMQEGLKDMSAWTHYNKTPAFIERAEAAANDRNTVYNIRQQQAALQAAQMQAAAENNRINQLMTQGVGGQGGQGGTALPANVIAALNATNPLDVEAKKAIINNYFKTDVTESTKSQYNPAWFTSKPSFVPQVGEELDLTPEEMKVYLATKQLPARYGNIMQQNVQGGLPTAPTGALTGAGGKVPISVARNNPGNLTDASGTIRTFRTPQEGDAALTEDLAIKLSGQSKAVKDRFGAQVGNFMSPALLAETWAPSTAKGNSVESTQNYGRAIANELGMSDPTAQIPRTPEALAKVKAAITKFEAGNNYPQPGVPVNKTLSPGETVVAPQAPAAQAPAAQAPAETSGFVPPYPRPINASQAAANRKAREDYDKQILQTKGKESETAATEAGKAYAQMNKLAEAAELNTIPAAQDVIDIATDPKRSHVLGYLHGGNKAATALYTASKHLTSKPPAQLEEEIITNKFTPQELADYRAVQNSAQKLGIDFAADVFKGARMGIGLEKMAMGAKGIGTDLPPEINARNAQLIRDASQFQVEKKQMFEEWAKTHGGRLASFDEFESTREYIKFRNDAKQNFLRTYRGILKEVKPGEEAPSTGQLTPEQKAQAELKKRREQGKQ